MGGAHHRVDFMKTQLPRFGTAPRRIEVEWEK